jgi:hypothetical protein
MMIVPALIVQKFYEIEKANLPRRRDAREGNQKQRIIIIQEPQNFLRDLRAFAVKDFDITQYCEGA